MAQQLAAREHAVIEEDALIQRLRHGDEAAFEGLFLRHYQQVYRVLYHLVGSREEAEDLAQETFMALYHQPPAAGMGAPLLAWLCRVALNHVYRANNRLKYNNRFWDSYNKIVLRIPLTRYTNTI